MASRIIKDARKMPLQGLSTAVAIGNFDGVHLGHQAVIGGMIKSARTAGLTSVVLTFDPHPARIFVPKFAPPLITTYDDRLALLAEMGPDVIVEQDFDDAFAALTAEEFMSSFVQSALSAKAVFVGYDFTYGNGRTGNVETIREHCRKSGMFAEIVSQVRVAGMVVSSTKIREFILEGVMDGASELLGRPYFVKGMVVKGQGRGVKLGFPTANIEGRWEILPPEGVYATITEVGGKKYESVTNIGANPTFGTARLTVETHILDFDRDIYGETISVGFVARLRKEIKFRSVDQLVKQMRMDVDSAKKYLSGKMGE